MSLGFCLGCERADYIVELTSVKVRILKIINKHDVINRGQIKTIGNISKKTLFRNLEDLEDNRIISMKLNKLGWHIYRLTNRGQKIMKQLNGRMKA